MSKETFSQFSLVFQASHGGEEGHGFIFSNQQTPKDIAENLELLAHCLRTELTSNPNLKVKHSVTFQPL